MTLGERYDEIADAYARWWAPVLSTSARSLLDRIAHAVARTPAATILDLGTGTGTVASAALARWPEVRLIAVDSSARMLALAQLSASGAPDRFSTVQADAADLPLEDASVDAVTSSFVVQLVDARRALAEARRVLRPDGTLAIVTWVGPDASFEPDLTLDDALDELGIDVPEDEEEDDETPGHFAAASELVDVVRAAGFRDVEADEGMLVHGFNAATYAQFLAEYGERALFESISPADARRLRRLTERYLRDLEPDQFLWQTPIVTVTARR